MDPPEPEPQPEPQPRPVQEGRRERELTRDQIVSRLLFELQTHGVDGKFARRTIPAVAQDFMCVSSKQLGTYGSVPSQIFRIRTFDNFAQAPKNAIVVVPESGTMTTFVKR
jgi:hypothetical protein